MYESTSIEKVLDIVSGILVRCFFMGFILIGFWFLFFLVSGDTGYEMHAKLFQITRHEYEIMNYYGMAFIKGCIFILFLLPYLAVKMVQRKAGANR